tara:strand:- start:2670 stop:3095 length:426 start_codon:yes stop_codon:yes gene_type:complete
MENFLIKTVATDTNGKKDMSYGINFGFKYIEVDLGKNPQTGDIIITPTSGTTVVLIHASAEFDPNGGTSPDMSIALRESNNSNEVTGFTVTVNTGSLSNVVMPLNGQFLTVDARIELSTPDTWITPDADANLKIRIFYMEV